MAPKLTDLALLSCLVVVSNFSRQIEKLHVFSVYYPS